MFRARLAAAVLALALPVAALAQDSAAVIDRQIDAFRAGDVETAWSFASPGIQELFGSPDRFGRMVEQGYPMVWRPAEVRHLDSRDVGDARLRRVMITDEAGAVHVLEYRMSPRGETWQIDGVRILREEQFGV